MWNATTMTIPIPVTVSFKGNNLRRGSSSNSLLCLAGFLLAVYANDLSGNKAQYFRRYQRDRPEPVTIMSNSDLEGAQFLRHAHDRSEQFHLYENVGANYTGSEALQAFMGVQPPEFGVLSTWNTVITWA